MTFTGRHPHALKFAFLAILLAAMVGSSLAALRIGAFKAGVGEIVAAILPGGEKAEDNPVMREI